jgi:hypothetical protein
MNRRFAVIRSRRKSLIACTLIACCAVAAMAAYVCWSDRTLLQSSKRVLKAQWGPAGEGDTDPRSYYWLSDHEILTYRYLPEGLTVIRHDVATDREEQMREPTALLRKFPEGVHKLQVSPDGKWILIGKAHGAAACAADGSAQVDWSLDGEFQWAMDGRHVLEFRKGGLFPDVSEEHTYLSAVSRSIEHPDQQREYDIGELQIARGRYGIRPDRSSWLLVASPTRFVSVEAWQPGVGHITIYDLIGGTWQAKQSDVHFPKGLTAGIERAILSPCGDRIAWVLHWQERPELEVFLNRVVPAIKVHDRRLTGIWTTNIDGRRIHEVGRLEDPTNVELQRYLDIRWLPSGKALSFVGKDGAVYVAPSE